MTADLVWREQQAKGLSGLAEAISVLRSDQTRRLAKEFATLIEVAGGALPRKAEFDPMVLGGVLSNAVLYDLRDPNHVVFRVVGETMMEDFQVNPVGRCYLEFVPEIRRQHALAAFRHCVEIPCAMLSRTIRVFKNGLSSPGEALGVPLAGADPNAPATHLLFVVATLHGTVELAQDIGPFHVAKLVERCFINLGRGVPTGFMDLVTVAEPGPFEG